MSRMGGPGELWSEPGSTNFLAILPHGQKGPVMKKNLVYYARIRYQRPFLAHEFAKRVVMSSTNFRVK